MSGRRLQRGVVGLGRAFSLLRPAFIASPLIKLVAAADPRPEARQRFAEEFHGTAWERLDEMLRDPAVEAVYIASPHQYHAARAIEAAGAGKHLLVELDTARIPRQEVIEELFGAIASDTAPVHSGEWGLATLEVCLALLQSARERREVALRRQIPVLARA